MNPQAPAVIPGQPIAPVANGVTAQGVATPPVVGAPTPSALPAAPQVAATPQPVVNPTYDTSGMANAIAGYYGIPRQTAQIVNAGQAQGNVAGQQFAAQKYQNTLNISNQQAELSPSGYTISKSSNGGVNITNVYGQPVSLGTYVNLTGANPADVLKDSTNPSDVKFVTAYNNLQTYIQDQIAAKNGDAQAQAEIQQYQNANPGLANMELGQLQQAFTNQYGSYLGMPQSNTNTLSQTPGLTPTLSSTNNPAALSAFENPMYASLPGGQSATPQTYTPSGAASGSNGAANSDISTLLSSLQSQAGS